MATKLIAFLEFGPVGACRCYKGGASHMVRKRATNISLKPRHAGHKLLSLLLSDRQNRTVVAPIRDSFFPPGIALGVDFTGETKKIGCHAKHLF